MKSERRAREGVMLAYPLDSWDRPLRWDVIIAQPKLNGIRARYLGAGDWRNSTNLPLTNIPAEWTLEADRVRHALTLLPDQQVVLDGEIYIEDSDGVVDETILSGIFSPKRRDVLSGVQLSVRARARFHVFDFATNILHCAQSVRVSMLHDTFLRLKDRLENLRMVDSLALSTANKSDAKADLEHWLKTFMAAGFEGMILRNSNALYQPCRTHDMLKVKPRRQDAYRVIGYEQERDKFGVEKEALGALICEDKRGQRFKVGTGPIFTRAARNAWWECPQALIGRWVVITYPGLTAANNIPKHPSALELRDTPPEGVDNVTN